MDDLSKARQILGLEADVSQEWVKQAYRDMVRVWNTARTADQIKANMHRLLTGNELGLQGCWRFEEGHGPTTADNRGHGFDGALIGNVTWTTNMPPITWR